DLEIDNGNVTDDLKLKRLEVSNKLFEEKNLYTKDAAQKAKVRWAIEGDENSKFFHGIINKMRSQLAIRGVFVNGVWLTDPGSVKLAFHDHFADMFKQPTSTRFKINTEFPNRLSSDQIGDLDKPISVEEIKAAVWDYGENKSPGPDGYTFEFYRHFWDLISKDFCADITYFFDHGSFPRGGNSSFVALIPKVIDAKFVNDFRPISLIGSVYKVVTKILATRACNEGIFKGLRIHDSLVLSHLFYADDAVFIGEWSDENLKNLVRILNCFQLASGFKINMTKSQIMGVGVPSDVLNQGASSIGC
nr:RNA-directed DNA polymerase, eukaryota [Tanacetum cinerariifolium]